MDVELPDPTREASARRRMAEQECLLDEPLRATVEAAIDEVCAYCNWNLHARSCRSNHVHVVVSAGGADPDTVMTKFKAYATRAIKRLAGAHRKNWWAEGGSTKYLNDEESLAKAVLYVMNQDKEQLPEG
jgi:REP element-mobilizing transposase RayT